MPHCEGPQTGGSWPWCTLRISLSVLRLSIGIEWKPGEHHSPHTWWFTENLPHTTWAPTETISGDKPNEQPASKGRIEVILCLSLTFPSPILVVAGHGPPLAKSMRSLAQQRKLTGSTGSVAGRIWYSPALKSLLRNPRTKKPYGCLQTTSEHTWLAPWATQKKRLQKAPEHARKKFCFMWSVPTKQHVHCGQHQSPQSASMKRWNNKYYTGSNQNRV